MIAIAFFLTFEVAASCTDGCNCVAVVGNGQAATDSDCTACPAQSYWPCDQPDLCRCSDAPTPAPVVGGECKPGCDSCEAIPDWMETSQCDVCLDGYAYWPCNDATLCQCQGSTTAVPTTSEQPITVAPTTSEQPTTVAPTTSEGVPCSTTDAPTTTGAPTTTDAPTTTGASSTTTASSEDPSVEDPSVEDPSVEDPSVEDPSVEDPAEVIDSTLRKAQATVFGDYTTISPDQVLCSQTSSDARNYMQGNPICATAIGMGAVSRQSEGTVDQNGNSGFCKRTTPGNGATMASSCWKVRCVGGDNALGVGVSCKHHDWIYLKTVDTNTENNLSLTDDQFNAQCENVTNSQPSCRAFDITVQAWDLMVVFASNQGSIAGEPAGLNGAIPIEYEEVNCNDDVVNAAIHSSHCGLPSQLII